MPSAYRVICFYPETALDSITKLRIHKSSSLQLSFFKKKYVYRSTLKTGEFVLGFEEDLDAVDF